MDQSTPIESEHLASARTGNAEAFNALVEPIRKPLLVHGYRLSGSLDDAEDLVQETFLRAWNKLDSYTGQGSFRSWLVVIATRLWLDEVRKRRKQVLVPLDGSPADPDSPPLPPNPGDTWLDPLPGSWLSGVGVSPEFSHERREAVSFAFIVALQKLNARQRVVLILREVFQWSAEDVAQALDLSVDSINNLLYRARKNLDPSRFDETPATRQHLDPFVKAWESGDVPSLIGLLNEKSTFAMPPMRIWVAGSDAIGRALRNFVFTPGVEWRLTPTEANGQPAFGMYQGSVKSGDFRLFGLILPAFEKQEGSVSQLTAFLSPQVATRFNLPPTRSA